MIGIVSIGVFSTSIAKKLCEFSDKLKGFAYDNLKSNFNMEDYENEFNEFPDPSGIERVYCLLDGYSPICGITLKVLSAFRNVPITIFFLTADKSILSNDERKTENICVNVLQEYTRSGVFRHMFLIDKELLWNRILEDPKLENMTLFELKNLLLDKVCWAVYMYHQTTTTLPIDGSILDFDNTIYRISTFFDIDSNDNVVLYYPMKYQRCYSYILSLPERLSKDDLNIMKAIRNKAKNHEVAKLEFYFSVFTDEQRALIGFCSTNVVQDSKYIT